MNTYDQQYLGVLDDLLSFGTVTKNRTGVDTLTTFGLQMRVSLTHTFPLLTTKKIHYKSCIHELIWMLSGADNIQYLKANGVTIWNEWARADGYVGRIYGAQWRKWTAPRMNLDNGELVYPSAKLDQINKLIHDIKANPQSRRHLVTAWNPAELQLMALPPCHFAFQCQVLNGKLNLHVFMRSLDVFLGLPFDIALYGLLLRVIAQVTNLIPGELLLSATDVHLYTNHIEQAKQQLLREPKELPVLILNTQLQDINLVQYSDFTLINYNPHPAIKADVAV